jgi:hypothetical protein
MARTREAPGRSRSRDGRAPNGRATDARPPAGPVSPISSLEERGSPWRRRTLRFARRLAAFGAFAAAGLVAYTYVAEPLLGGDDEAAVAEEVAPGAEAAPVVEEEPPPRPEAVPARIPQWAWALNEWHSTPQADRGPRPGAAPARVPGWYWEWRSWRAELAAQAGS